MKYKFYNNIIKDVKLAIAIDIVKGKYIIGEPMPKKLKLVECYDISRPAFDTVCEELESENVIRSRGERFTSLYVPRNTTAASYVAQALTERLKECSRILESIGFGAREARNQLFLKQIVNTLPLKLKEMEKEGRIQMCNSEVNAVWNTPNSIDESIMISPDGYEDIINVLQDML